MQNTQPYATAGVRQDMNFIVMTKEHYDYFIKSKKTLADLSDYKKVRETFSQADLASVLAHGTVISCFLDLLSKKLLSEKMCVNLGQVTSSLPSLWKLSPEENLELEKAVMPSARSMEVMIADEVDSMQVSASDLSNYMAAISEAALNKKEGKDTDTGKVKLFTKGYYEINDDQNDLFRVLPLANSDYYLIVLDKAHLHMLKIRDEFKRLLSECLKIVNTGGTLENNSGYVLYVTYLGLLKLEQRGVPTL